MKKIVLHGPAIDAAGNFCDAGTELEIGDKAKAGTIAAESARQLVAAGTAVSATAEAAQAKRKAPIRKRARGAAASATASRSSSSGAVVSDTAASGATSDATDAGEQAAPQQG